MIVNNIHYGIELYIDDEDGNEIGRYLFDNFDEMNAFSANPKIFQKYLGCYAQFAFVEIIDGEPNAPYSFFDYDFDEYDEEEIDGFINELIEEQKILQNNTQGLSEECGFQLTPKSSDPNKKLIWKNEYTYVCRNCMFELENCECENYPYSLIQIDTVILPVIRELNRKGYFTVACCSGHNVEPQHLQANIYINFKEAYDFKTKIPDNWKYSSYGVLTYKNELSNDEFETTRKKLITELLSWVNALPMNEII